MRKIIYSLVLFLVIPLSAHAQVVMTEIMYDVEGIDTGREWIEVKNIGTETVDLSAWKLFEGNVNHKITVVGSPALPPGGFAVIADVTAKFAADHAGFSGLLFDSVFSLGNEGETLVIRDPNGVDVDSVSYTSVQGAVGDGNSLQKTTANIWIAAVPTPGNETTATQSTVTSEPENPTDNSDPTDSPEPAVKNTDVYSTHSSQVIANISFDAPEFTVTGGRSRIGFVGTPLTFEGKVQSMKNIPVGNLASFVWSMGDGTQKSGQFIAHTYEFPGDYIVILNSSVGGGEAVSKIKVKIIQPSVDLIAADERSVELENKDGYELNIGGWTVETKGERRVIASDTIIAPRGKIRILVRSLGLRGVAEYIKILNPKGEVLSNISLAGIGALNMGDVQILLPQGFTVEGFKQALGR